jgi:hypothetical protein
MTPVRLTAVPDESGDVRLVMPVGRHLESESWWVVGEIVRRLLVLRVWLAASDGFRVIVLDGIGAEHGSLIKDTYRDATELLGVAGPASHTQIDGRRLVSGGDRDYEIAAEIHTRGGEQLLYVRVWLQAKQRFVLYVIDAQGRIRDRATGTYDQAKARAVSHLDA